VVDQQFDAVECPKHYNSHPSGVECADITEHYDFNTGNVIKYCWRAGLKVEEGSTPLSNQIKDLKKARWYVEREIKLKEKQLKEMKK